MNRLNWGKQLLCVCLVLFLTLALTACGRKTEDPVTSPEGNTTEPPALTPETKPEEEPEPEPPIPFTDVPEDAPYYNTIVWAYENGILSDGSTFDPDSPCTRAQVITFIWRAMGSPEPQTAENPFSDISSSDWYYKPALWAYENTIVTNTTFNSNNACTNAEALTFLWRAEGKPMTAVYSSPTALAASDAYYAKPVAWAENSGMFAGMDSAFDPTAPCFRADLVTYLHWAAEQWAVPEEDKTIQAEYEQIINDAQLYEVHGSGLLYADYVDVDEDGKVELLTLAYDGDEVTVTVYANMNGHAEVNCKGTMYTYDGDGFSLCRADGQLFLQHWVFSGNAGETYDFYKIENSAFTFYEQATVFYRMNASESDTEILQKYTDEKNLVTISYDGVSVTDRGILPNAAEYRAAEAKYWEENCDQIYAAVLEGDFSYFAGYYVSTDDFNSMDDVVLDKNGLLSMRYLDVTPISITVKDSGVIHCVILEPTYWEPEDVDGDGEADLGGFYLEEYYDIYPFGVGDEYVDTLGSNQNFYDDLDKVRIHYFIVDGGVADVTYYKVS